ncbi:MAG TPA: hypothetical protein VEB21_14305 [Terriglobales bacterium]|nr:hypothetical protein [Terriglobales bacterium]
MLALLGIPGAVPAQVCGGDCDGGGSVSVDELVRGVSIALGTVRLSECEAFDSSGDGSVTVDELVAAVSAALEGCRAGAEQAFIIATNFSTGSFATIGVAPPHVLTPVSAERQIHPDAVARQFGGLVYVINRFMGDSIQLIDPQQGFATRARCLTGAELSNPHDIAFVDSEKAYVSLFDRPEILIVDPTPGDDCQGFVRDRIDLSAFGDGDGLAESDVMAIAGGKLYVLLQRLDRDNFFVPSGPGGILEIDIASDTVLRELELTTGNPFAQTQGLWVENGSLVVAEANELGKNDGGIERIDPIAGTALGFFVTEETLGGDITDFVLVDERLGYAVVSLADFSNALVRFDPTTGAKLETVLSGGNYADIELNDRGELWVADSTFGAAGIRIFSAASGVELTPEPIALGLPPFSIVFVP